jgi:RNA polymerase sigma factor (sigma-70 family)
MNEWPDMRLLREYAERGSEDAFRVLVSRHLGLVYHAALRQTRQPQLAEEIVQTVFTILARKAKRIPTRTLVSGWLFNTARFVSIRAVRDESRRQRRLAELARMSPDSAPAPVDPENELLPLLDELLARLPSGDRNAVLARYFEGKSFAEVGAAVGATEEAAKKRVHRALEKMRGILVAREVPAEVAAVVAAIQKANAGPLPAAMSAASVCSGALKAASGAATLSGLTRTALELMRWTRIKVATASVVAILLGFVAANHFSSRRPANGIPDASRNDAAADAAQLDRLQAAADRLRAENAQLTAALATASSRKAQLLSASREVERLTRESREATARNLTPTNGSASMRDAFVSLGKLLRFGVAEQTGPTPQARKAAREAANEEVLRMLKAAGRLQLVDMDGYSPSSVEEAAELATAMLHGIVDLSTEQFAQVQAALANYERQAQQADPQRKPELPELETISTVVGQIQELLTEEQRDLLKRTLQRVNAPAGAEPSAVGTGEQSAKSP